jgi:hypothetical protein
MQLMELQPLSKEPAQATQMQLMELQPLSKEPAHDADAADGAAAAEHDAGG